ncbi:hypothetical protein EVAR_76297_1 [Eumeta japonica]|uniref:Uncharacterized protein n=1 Tax=Eumeta variegata TaxID=151549 RepID=A0A4C1UQE9_EUMVA|nr:hypothetical protein EVAR_76297_1 [Eumeta japonica]
MVPEVEDRSKPRQISSHTPGGKIRVDSLSTKHSQSYVGCEHSVATELQILRVTLDKIYTSEIISSVLEYCTFYKARLGAMLGRKSKLSRRNKRTIYKMCIRTVMTYPCLRSRRPKALL